MHAVPRLLIDLATVLAVASATTLVCRKLRAPVVLGYIVAGLIVGPHLTSFFNADLHNVSTLSELGVILLMFSIGLEFSLRRMMKTGPMALVIGTLQVALAVWLGFLASRILGWSRMDSIFLGAAMAFSSTMIVARLLGESKRTGPVREIVFSVLVVQDLYAILMLTLLTTVAAVGGGGAPTPHVVLILLKLAGFAIGAFLVGRIAFPRLIRWVADHIGDESLLVTGIALCFAGALLAHWAGYSTALGAFLAGMLVAESGRSHRVEALIHPIRDLFSAVFFVSVGMLLNPALVPAQLPTILALTLLILVLFPLSVAFIGMLAGVSLRTGLLAGLALAQIGEFSFIIMGTGLAAGAIRAELLPIAISVSILTATLSPLLMYRAGNLTAHLEGLLPQAFLSTLGLYQAWANSRERQAIRKPPTRRFRRPLAFLLADALLLVGTLIGAALLLDRGLGWLSAYGRRDQTLTLAVLTIAIILAAAFLLWSLTRTTGLVARQILESTATPFPAWIGPRLSQLLYRSLHTALLLTVGIPILASTQPFFPRHFAWLPLAGALAAGALLLTWKLKKHHHDGPVLGSEWLLGQLDGKELEASATPEVMLRPIRIHALCPSIGKTLGALDLSNRAGVRILAIFRKAQPPITPKPDLLLEDADLLILEGLEEQVSRASALLDGES